MGFDRQATRRALRKKKKKGRNDSVPNNLPRFLPTNSSKDIKKKKLLNYVLRPNETPVQTSKDLLCLSQILLRCFLIGRPACVLACTACPAAGKVKQAGGGAE